MLSPSAVNALALICSFICLLITQHNASIVADALAGCLTSTTTTRKTSSVSRASFEKSHPLCSLLYCSDSH